VRFTGGRRHAEQLAPAIKYACTETGVRLEQLAAIAVGIGPGLFTGLRVGVTTARTMAQALRIPVIPVSSLDLVAYPLRHAGRRIVVVLDARRREVFHAAYQPVPGGVQRDSEYGVGPVRDLVADLDATGEEVLLAGDGVARYRKELSELERAEEAGPGFDAPNIGALVELATGRFEREEFSAPWDVLPMYLRASDAELHWESPVGARVR
jgi:tRNA threonylcarbamoyladenosine biosynthesis protein TsaB